MPRPKLTRIVQCRAPYSLYKPNGVPARDLARVSLQADELEAMRLVDMEGMTQQQAAEAMGVSRQTLGNIVAGARCKVVSVLVRGEVLELAHPVSSNNEDIKE